MGACFSASRREEDIRPEEKWEFISLNDFKSTSVFTPLAYGYLFLSLLISVAVYGVDSFTAVNLLAFNKWSSEISPAIPLSVSKWIFSICIILSFVNLGFEYIRAIRVIKRGSVAESYLDSLAVRLQSARSWKRFLVFAELTKSKKGAEYVALFTYFSFLAWIRIIFCSGPRQVVNALTLWSVFQAQLEPEEDGVGASILQFFDNIAILAKDDYRQAIVLSGMLFTLVIWVVQALSLILAALFYLFFLWHWIPNHDAGLSGYCQRKIGKRLAKIVSAKVNKALEEEERKRLKLDKKAAKNGEKPLGRQATLPQLFDPKTTDKLPDMPMLNRNDTMSTLPAYTSRPGTPSSQMPKIATFELSNLDSKRPGPTRNGTTATNASYTSNAPLLGAAADMGYDRPASPAGPLDSSFPPVQRSLTGSTSASTLRGPASLRSAPSMASMNGPARTMTPGAYPGSAPPMPGLPSRSMTSSTYQGGSTPGMPGAPSRSMTSSTFQSNSGPNIPGPNMTGPPRTMTPGQYGGASAGSVAGPNMNGPPRTMTPGQYANSSAGSVVGSAMNGPPRTMTPGAYPPNNMPGPARSMTGGYPGSSAASMNGPIRTMTPGIYTGNSAPLPGSGMPGGPAAMDSYGRPLMSPTGSTMGGRAPPSNAPSDFGGRSTPFDSANGRGANPYSESMNRASPAPTFGHGTASPAPGVNPRGPATAPVRSQTTTGYMAYNPSVGSASTDSYTPEFQAPHRNMTEPLPARNYEDDDASSPEAGRTETPQSSRTFGGSPTHGYRTDEPRSPASHYAESEISHIGSARGVPPPGRYQQY